MSQTNYFMSNAYGGFDVQPYHFGYYIITLFQESRAAVFGTTPHHIQIRQELIECGSFYVPNIKWKYKCIRTFYDFYESPIEIEYCRIL